MVEEYYFTAAQSVHFLSHSRVKNTPGRKSKLYGRKRPTQRQPLKKRLIGDQMAAIWTHLQVRWLDLHRPPATLLHASIVCLPPVLSDVQLNRVQPITQAKLKCKKANNSYFLVFNLSTNLS
jgi:hypothetical protein